MELEALLQRLGPWFDRHRRLAWRPITETCDSPMPCSKFSGIPWVPEGEEWPRCAHCGEPIALFLQLDLSQLPEGKAEPSGSGLLQFFYCVNTAPDCVQECDGWSHFSDAHLIRIIRPDGPARQELTPRFESTLPARVITGWEPIDDFPHAEEFGSLGLSIRFDDPSSRTYDRITIECPEVGLLESNLPVAYWSDPGLNRCAERDKLGGWPFWIQSAEYPNCLTCGRRMELVFQIDSEDNLAFMFGDVGCGHLTQCPDHPDMLAFGWACG
ncbi:DUF1963 domain-containing protein [Tautonia rosea]|uniref:DUF1963 domain-containing protein n=1 Tax=Tautonia rosea TaxID=2728037 RepID=UPI001476591C|nr:DUF1963 domain-containing protein [Tautonia rosea]